MKIKRNIYSAKKPVNLPLKRKISLYMSRFYLGAKLVLGAAVILLIVTKQSSHIFQDVRYKICEFFGDYGYSLENVIITGQNNVSNAEIIKSLNADVGTPIFSINLDDSLNELTKNGWIKSAIVQRKLPDTIIVDLLEREPIALWQVNKELFVIDKEGEVIKATSPEKFKGFIYLVGEDANVYAAQLIDLLAKKPELASKVIYAVRYGQRRWDLNLQENINVKLPQENLEPAYDYLIKLFDTGKLFGNSLKTIDLRDKKKYYIEKIKESKSLEKLVTQPIDKK